MKTLLLKRLTCLCIITALFVMTYNILNAQTGPQVLDDPRYEIILKVNPDVFSLPEGTKTVELSETDTLSRKLQVISPEISEALKKHEVNKIRKAFPDFTQADRIKITRKGRLVTLRDKSNIHILRVKNIENVSTLIDAIKELPGVIYAESNYTETKQANGTVMPDDDYFSYQWGLHNNDDHDIDAPEAWYITTGSDILVGVVDNGVRKTHEDFTNRVSGDTYNNSGTDPHHGTEVAGIIAAEGDNTDGIAGVNWNAEIYSSAIDYDDPSVIEKAAAVDEAVSEGCLIINNSWFNDGYYFTIRSAFADAFKSNIVPVGIMGNDGNSTIRYPGAYGGVLAVGATNDDDEKPDFSNWGNHNDVVAPGVDIVSLQKSSDDDYTTTSGVSGTSFAAPHVSGVASLMLSIDGALDNDDIENIIEISADNVPAMEGEDWTAKYGHGRLNAYRALQYLRPPYEYHHSSASNCSDGGASNRFNMDIYDSPSVPDGVGYIVKRHEITKTVNYSSLGLDSVHVWGIGIDTDGVSYENPNFSVPWATTVGTVTNSSATVKTLVYEVRNSLGQWIGWHPTSPENVEIGYTVWGFKPDPIVNLTGPTSMYDDETKQWGASIYDGSSPFSHKWYRKDFGSANFSQVGSSSSYSYGTPDTSFYLCVQITDNASRSDADTITVTVSHRPLSVEIDGYHLPYAYYDWENTWWGEVSGGYPPYNTYAWSMRVFDDVEEEWTEWESVCSDSIYDIERDDWEDLEELFDYEFEIGSDIQLKVVVTDNAQATDEDIIDLEVTEAQKMSAKPLPKGFKLEQNYPNPFNPVTTISFQLPKSSNVTLVIYNIQGREVARLVDGYVGAGYHSTTWDASTAASGIYIYRLQAGEFSDTKRMLLIK